MAKPRADGKTSVFHNKHNWQHNTLKPTSCRNLPPCSCVRGPQKKVPLSGQSSFLAGVLFRPVQAVHLNRLEAVRKKRSGKRIPESTFQTGKSRRPKSKSAASLEADLEIFRLQQPNVLLHLQAQPAKPARHAGCVSKPRDWCDCQVQAIVRL